ncbi:MAG: hypothetical protein AAGI34_08310 [Pseudomonadota bacterium]
MSDKPMRVDLKVGEIAISVHGFENPLPVFRRMLTLLSETLERAPQLPKAGIDFDAATIERLMQTLREQQAAAGLSAAVEVTPGLIVTAIEGKAEAAPVQPAAAKPAPPKPGPRLEMEPVESEGEPPASKPPVQANAANKGVEDAEVISATAPKGAADLPPGLAPLGFLQQPGAATATASAPAAAPAGNAPINIFADPEPETTPPPPPSATPAPKTTAKAPPAPPPPSARQSKATDKPTPASPPPAAAKPAAAPATTAPRIPGTAPKGKPNTPRLDALMAQHRTSDAAKPAETKTAPAKPAAAPADDTPPQSPAALMKKADAKTVTDLLGVAAAYVSLIDNRETFTRREVMEVFDQLPGEHPRSLEARIKGFGALVSEKVLVKSENDRFTLSEEAKTRFSKLL